MKYRIFNESVKEITEGIKKGGLNKKPSTPRPSNPPKAMRIKTVKVEKICPLSLAMTNNQVEYCFQHRCTLWRPQGFCGLMQQPPDAKPIIIQFTSPKIKQEDLNRLREAIKQAFTKDNL